MGKVVAFKPDVVEEVHNIAARWAEADRTLAKGGSIRVEVGMRLLALRKRIEAGEAGKGTQWWPWVRDYICTRTKRDMEKCMALARAEDPQAAAEMERINTRNSVRAHRQRSGLRKTQSTVVGFRGRSNARPNGSPPASARSPPRACTM